MIRNWDTETGDLVTSGENQFLEGKADTAAAIRHRLLMFFGEYFLNIADGTPFFQSILGKKPQDVAEQAIKQRIATAPGVVAITDFRFDSDRAGRSITVEAQILDVNNESIKFLLGEDVIDEGGIIPPPPQPETSDIINLNQQSIVVDE